MAWRRAQDSNLFWCDPGYCFRGRPIAILAALQKWRKVKDSSLRWCDPGSGFQVRHITTLSTFQKCVHDLLRDVAKFAATILEPGASHPAAGCARLPASRLVNVGVGLTSLTATDRSQALDHALELCRFGLLCHVVTTNGGGGRTRTCAGVTLTSAFQAGTLPLSQPSK